jgi:hypothetical protein
MKIESKDINYWVYPGPNYADNRKLYSSLKYIFPLNRKIVDLTPFRRKAKKNKRVIRQNDEKRYKKTKQH